MMGLPGVERIRRLQDGAVALDVSISLAIEATMRLPISSRTKNASSSLWSNTSAQTMRAVRVSVELDHDREAVPRRRSIR